MIVRNGICYPDIPERHVKIVAAENVGDHLLRVRFDDGDVRIFDGRVLSGEVFEPLRSPAAFAAWKLDYETLTWNDDDIDISADFVLNHSRPCPLALAAGESPGLLFACEPKP